MVFFTLKFFKLIRRNNSGLLFGYILSVYLLILMMSRLDAALNRFERGYCNMNKVKAILGVSALLLSTSVMAESEVAFKNNAKDALGIGYEWSVKLGHHGSAEITGSVGGKSSFEPEFTAPQIGWTHTSDWVELELEADVILEIEVSRQQGIYEKKKDGTYSTAGAMLYPALSVYKGWDTTTEKEKGSFNPTGKFWSTIEFKDVVYSKHGETTIIYRAKMKAGQYSVDIGGVNALYCAETDECFNGKHGYRAKFSASHMPNMQEMKK